MQKKPEWKEVVKKGDEEKKSETQTFVQKSANLYNANHQSNWFSKQKIKNLTHKKSKREIEEKAKKK